ncbi:MULTISPECIES: saccharopine dehydrogenase family protein [Gammaproteobacteria]|uniref:saccharopine dehydrogenase family protein n=1 Tax=Gammaproteobacteria TaxID=1236 RepID=UPI003A8DD8D8
MTAPRFDLVVFGATSFVGQILTRYLSQYLAESQEPLRWAIAGRSAAKLEMLKAALGEAGQQLPILISDATDAGQIAALCAQTRAVVSTVGPYALYGEPLIKACAEGGTDYCDLTGEAQWIKRMVDKYQAAARHSGARIVHCCGFDSVPSDMGVWLLQQEAVKRWGQPLGEITMRVKAMKGGASGGTVASILQFIEEALADPAIRQDINNPYSLCPPAPVNSARQHQVKAAEYDHNAQSWAAPFLMAAVNERVVHRSNALLGQAYGQGFSYNEALLTGPGLKGRLKAFGVVAALGTFMLGALVKPGRYLMQRFLLPKPGEGPSEAAQLAGHFDLRFWGKGEAGQALSLKVTGDRDPGYGATAKMLGQAALFLALNMRAGSEKTGRPGGFWTPASAFGEGYLDRLRCHSGMTFELGEGN